jgi:hypothetical protein
MAKARTKVDFHIFLATQNPLHSLCTIQIFVVPTLLF